MYDNANDAHRYLNNTVCMFDGKPVYVAECRRNRDNRNGIDVIAYPIPYTGLDAAFVIDLADARFNAMKFKLGYMQYGDDVVYLSRRPSRIQSQGLCGSNVTVRGNRDLNGRGGFNVVVREKGFSDMMTGEYKTPDEARKMLTENPRLRAVPISRDIALKRHGTFKNLFFLAYKGEDVAYSDNPTFKLPEEYSYLNEICKKRGVA